MTDNINPSHYKDGFSNGTQVIDITENLNFNRGNVVKYVARAGEKDLDTEYEDLEKAKWYLDRELARMARYWYNPPTYQIVPDFTGTIGSTEAYVNQPIEEYTLGPFTDLEDAGPRVWQSLADLPVDTIVTDKEGDQWKVKPNGQLRVRFFEHDGFKKWEAGNKAGYPLSAWDGYAPFTEVVDD